MKVLATLQKTHRLAHLILGFLLIGAQLGAALHAFEHDIGTPQGKVCVACVAASQLGSASLDTQDFPELPKQHLVFTPVSSERFKSHAVIAARQRGPPNPL